MSGAGPRGVLRVGDRVRVEGRVQTVAGLAGTTVTLVDERQVASLVMFSYLVGAEGFELLDSRSDAPGLPPFGLLDTVPEGVLARARFFERHLVEVETGLLPDAPAGTKPRPELDPAWRTLQERIAAKAAELTAAGTPVSDRTLRRMRDRRREQGVWGLVDRRATRFSGPAGGRSDERLVAVVQEVLASQQDVSTGTRGRVMRQVERLLVERHGEGVVPIPSKSVFLNPIQDRFLILINNLCTHLDGYRE